MKFESKINETIFISTIFPERRYMFNNDLKTGLSVIWNTGQPARFRIDNELVTIDQNCVIFLTEFYQIDDFEFEKFNVIQFNRLFYCVNDNDETGCKGLLFYGMSHVPKIEIPQEKLTLFQSIWEVFVMEMEETDHFKLEMLRALLRRFLILCIRIYKKENNNLPTDNVSVGLIREFNYLVDQHFRSLTKVSDYARLLHKSPKTLSNIFKKYIDRSPLQIINQRRLLEAKRLLKYTDKSIQEIADKINFNDVQSFSNFFRSRTGTPPTLFRNKDH
ncbi:MAG: helix-turn-helix domain-containing protein [Bacteroidota bacterium]